MENCQRIIVVGISGTGKSRLGQILGDRLGAPVHHMDSLIWKEGWTEASAESIQTTLDAVARTDRWIVEGWIDSYSHSILERADAVLYLDFAGWQAALGALQRTWRYRGTHRPELPAGCNEELDLEFLRVILHRSERPHIEQILAGVPVRIVTLFATRKAIRDFLRSM